MSSEFSWPWPRNYTVDGFSWQVRSSLAPADVQLLRSFQALQAETWRRRLGQTVLPGALRANPDDKRLVDKQRQDLNRLESFKGENFVFAQPLSGEASKPRVNAPVVGFGVSRTAWSGDRNYISLEAFATGRRFGRANNPVPTEAVTVSIYDTLAGSLPDGQEILAYGYYAPGMAAGPVGDLLTRMGFSPRLRPHSVGKGVSRVRRLPYSEQQAGGLREALHEEFQWLGERVLLDRPV